MSFRVAARTLLQLGAELISSDAIAFFELVKNSFDASSPRVDIDVVIRLNHDVYETQRQFVSLCKTGQPNREALEEAGNECKDAIISGLDYSAPHATALEREVRDASSWDELSELLDGANYILIEDTGHGMSLTDLEDVYLTIGTRYRLNERNQQLGSPTDKSNRNRPVLGEKGIGRLSAMRLGWRIKVDTTESRETHWNQLEIDWRRFDTPLEQFVGDVEIIPTIGDEKERPQYSGTRISISALTSTWTWDKFRAVAKDFSKLTNPFAHGSRYPISLKFNGDAMPIPRLDRILFEQAHGAIKAEYSVDPGGPGFLA